MSEFSGIKCDTCGKKHLNDDGYPDGWVIIHPATGDVEEPDTPAFIQFMVKNGRSERKNVVITNKMHFCSDGCAVMWLMGNKHEPD